ncbi:MAG TPA: hypothetical protein VM532_15675 [Burkholderiales bacterium]|nr:hypothetical protein [Burkholderiales bacterium]
MKPFAKAGLVAAGYIAAFAIASLVVAIYVAATSGSDRQASGGMFAFGDSLLFLVVFGLAAVPATCATLFFLRPYRAFWVILSVAALVITTTSLAALLGYVATKTSDPRSVLHYWSAFAVLRILVAPLFATAFLLSGLFAPNRAARVSLFVAMGIETAVFAYVAVTWLFQFHG